MVFLWWCGGVFVVVWWCFLWCFCGGVFVAFLWWCGGVVVFLWWCGGVFVVVLLYVFCQGSTFIAFPRSYAKSVDNTGVKRCLV